VIGLSNNNNNNIRSSSTTSVPLNSDDLNDEGTRCTRTELNFQILEFNFK